MLVQTNTDTVSYMLGVLRRAQESTELSWRKPWAALGPIRNLATKRKYTGSWNLFRLAQRDFQDPRWATRRQIMEMMGYKKGSGRFGQWQTATGDLAPKDIFPKYDENDYATVPTKVTFAGRGKVGDGEEDPGSARGRPVFASYSVYNYEQIRWVEGKDPGKISLVRCDPSTATQAELKAVNLLKRSCQQREIEVTDGDAAMFLPVQKKIIMPSPERFDSYARYVSTFAHEVAHSTALLLSDCRDTKAESRKSAAYALEELVAELAAVQFTRDHEIDCPAEVDSQHVTYLAGWFSLLKFKDDAFLHRVVQAANDAVSLIKTSGLDIEVPEL